MHSDYTTPTMTQVKNFSGFLNWWWCGLTGFSSSGSGRMRFIELIDGNVVLTSITNTQPTIVDPSNQKLIAKQIWGSSCFALAPQDKIINTPIPAALKNESLETIAETLLPFKSQELYCTTDPENTELFAISKVETAPLIAKLEGFGVPLAGIGFSTAAGIHRADITDRSRRLARSIKPTVSLAALLALLMITSFIGLLGWQAENRHQNQLQTELQRLQQQYQLGATAVQPANLEQPEVPNMSALSPAGPARVQAVLDVLLDTMPAGTGFNQIMLGNSEMVIDGQAASATDVLANIEKSEAFANSKFVTAISSGGVGEMERFRLTTAIQLGSVEQPIK